jgi:hypothetical protein
MTTGEAVQVTYKLDDIVPVIQIHKRLEHDQKAATAGGRTAQAMGADNRSLPTILRSKHNGRIMP